MKCQLSIVMIFILSAEMFFSLNLSTNKNLKSQLPGFSRTTPVNEDGSGNVYYLDRHYLECPAGNIISGFHFQRQGSNQFFYEYNCRQNQAISNKSFVEKQTPFNIVEQGGNYSVNYLDRHDVKCDDSYGLVAFGVIRQGDKIAYKYKCAKVMKSTDPMGCSDKTTPRNECGNKANIYLDRHSITSDENTYIQGFKLNSFYDNLTPGNQCFIQYTYRLCKLRDISSEIRLHEDNIRKFKDELDNQIPRKIRDAESQISNLKSEQHRLNRRIRRLNKQIEELSQEINEKKARSDRKKRRVDDLSKSVSDFNSKIDNANRTKSDLERQKNDLMNKIQNEEGQLRSLKDF